MSRVAGIDVDRLRREANDARATAEAAEAEIRAAYRRLENAAPAVCGKCLRLMYSPEFGYTFCSVIGNVSGRFRDLDEIAKLEGGKFVCREFMKGGTLGRAGYGNSP